MERYLFYWRRGWWACLMIACINLGGMVLFFRSRLSFLNGPAPISSLALWHTS